WPSTTPCCLTRPPPTPTSAPTTTNAGRTSAARPATTSAASNASDTKSPSSPPTRPPQPPANQPPNPPTPSPTTLRAAGCCRLPGKGSTFGPEPNQVPTLLDSARPSETSRDTKPALNCGKWTLHDAVRRNQHAWHAEGQGFESP